MCRIDWYKRPYVSKGCVCRKQSCEVNFGEEERARICALGHGPDDVLHDGDKFSHGVGGDTWASFGIVDGCAICAISFGKGAKEMIKVTYHTASRRADDACKALSSSPALQLPPAKSMTAEQPHSLDSKYECLKLTRIGPHVVVVTLDRPRKRNAMSAQMWREIGQCFRTLCDTGCVRVVILRGAGPCFSAGLDLSDPSILLLHSSSFGPGDASKNHTNNDTTKTSPMDPARRGLSFAPKIREMQACFTAIEECPVPVIAAIHGNCIGGGVDLITACDVRLCSEDARFSVLEVAIGLAADVGTLQRLPKVTGNDSLARQVCLTGEMFGADEAERMGLVSRVVRGGGVKGLMQEVVRLAMTIAAHSPVAVMGTKRSLVYSRDHTVADGLEHIATHNALALQTKDLSAAFLATKRKQTAEFANFPPICRL